MHNLHFLCLALQLPRVKEILDPPIHRIFCYPFEEILFNTHFVLISPPSSKVYIQDALSLLLEGLYDLLDAIRAVSELSIVFVVIEIFYSCEELFVNLVLEKR